MSGFSDASIAALDARRYSRSVGFRAWESVYGTPGRCCSSSFPSASSCTGLAIDHSRQTATASTWSSASCPITSVAAASSSALTTSPWLPIRSSSDLQGVGDRPQQADGDSLDLELGELSDHVGRGGLVERPDDLALAADPLVYLERQRARDVRVGAAVAPVEGMRSAALAQQQHVGVPPGCEQGRARRRVREDRVGGARGAVDEDLHVGEERLDRDREVCGG